MNKSIIDAITETNDNYLPHLVLAVECSDTGKILASKILTSGNNILLLGLKNYLESLLSSLDLLLLQKIDESLLKNKSEYSNIIDELNILLDRLILENPEKAEQILIKYKEATLEDVTEDKLNDIKEEILSFLQNPDISLKD
ncbi:MAG: hypothetical protein EOL97_09020 [Spirochaetia bacterium]|nr:hypothetical protein [Spirochaetia bacterium]